MEEKIDDFINDDGSMNMERLIHQYYGYVYTVLKNFQTVPMSNEDVEEIIADTFFAIWKSVMKQKAEIHIQPYLAGTVKNIVKKRYRDIKINAPIEDYEEKVVSMVDLDVIIEENEKYKIIKSSLEEMNKEEYTIFILFYYRGKKLKEIANILHISVSKAKVTLYRVRKKIQKNLKKGGYDNEL